MVEILQQSVLFSSGTSPTRKGHGKALLGNEPRSWYNALYKRLGSKRYSESSSPKTSYATACAGVCFSTTSLDTGRADQHAYSLQNFVLCQKKVEVCGEWLEALRFRRVSKWLVERSRRIRTMEAHLINVSLKSHTPITKI